VTLDYGFWQVPFQTPRQTHCHYLSVSFHWAGRQGSEGDKENLLPRGSSYSCTSGHSLTWWHPSQMKDSSQDISFDIIPIDDDGIKLEEEVGSSFLH
jgi:hypothetical protein